MRKLTSLILALLLVATLPAGLTLAEGGNVVTLTMLSQPANDSGLLTDTWMANYLKSELGIQVELIPNTEGKLEALVAADSLPDIVIINQGVAKIKLAIDAGQLVPLSDHKDALPLAYQYCATSMQYYADNMSSDGKTYMLSNNIGPKAAGPSLNWETSTRWDYYKEMGMPEVKTVWDYLPVLKAMQDAHPTNADGQKVYAISCWSDWDGSYMQQATQVAMHLGFDAGDQFGNYLPYSSVNYQTLELGNNLELGSPYIEGLKWHFQANQLGILDPDSMTQTWNSFLEKAAAGRVLFAWWSWAVSGYNTLERVNADTPTGFQPVLPSESHVPLFVDSTIGGHWSWGIGHNTQNLDKCLEYLNFMCNPDKVFILSNGPKGETWDVNADGKPYLTDFGLKVAKDGTLTFKEGGRMFDGIALINSCPLADGVVSPLYGAPIGYTGWETYKPDYTKLQLDWQATTGFETATKKLLSEGTYTKVPLAQSLCAPMTDDIRTTVTAISDIVRMQSWKAIFAKDETEFNQIVEQMISDANALGLQDVLTYNQKVWADAVALAAKYQ